MIPRRRHLVPLLLLCLGSAAWCGPCSAVETGPSTLTQIKSLEELASYVRKHYYLETNPVELYDGAIEGYLSRLDPHSTYINWDQLKETQERLQGSFEGIGIYFDIIDNYLTVLSPIEGSPAHQVGLLPGDRIVRIDGGASIAIKADEVTRRLKGPKGTKVHVTVQRNGYESVLEFDIVRDRIEIPSVPYAFKLSPDAGYIKVSRFTRHTPRELKKEVEALKGEGIANLILDLRGNGGGYLDQAVEVADLLLEKNQLVVYTEGRRQASREDHYSENVPAVSSDIPLLVLVNSYSASASEIIAGAVQDYDRGLIVGQTTFGKGLVQRQFALRNGGAVLLTVARYFTPSGRPIQRPFDQDHVAYTEAGRDGYDPNADPDSTALKPIYYTRFLRRKVFGNGGITPDITLAPDTLSAFESRLRKSRLLVEFATRHAPEVAQKYPDFEEFLGRYRPGRREFADVKHLLKDRGEAFTEGEFRESADFIRREIKRQIAQVRWGIPAAGRVSVSQDPGVIQAVRLFDRARDLLASRAHHYDRGQTHLPEHATPAHGRVR